MDKIKVVFCGTPMIGAGILETLISMKNVEVVLVISQPDRPLGRKKIITPTPVKLVALNNHLPVVQPEKIISCFEQIKSVNPHFIITCAYGQFIPEKILKLPLIDAINIHASLLPKYRGGAPIQYAIKNGDKETGISIMQMVKQMDAGAFYIQEKIKIDEADDTGSMFVKMKALGQKLIKDNLSKIFNHELKLTNQDESEVSFAKNITPEQEKINWSLTAFEIHNLIRSLSPSPIAHTFLDEQRYKIRSTQILQEKSTAKPGTIVQINKKGIVVATNDYNLLILQIQRPGKKMSFANIYYSNNVNDMKVGKCFE